jgi:uncharacterized protein
MDANFFNSKPMRILGSLTLFMVILALGSYASLNFEKINFLNPTPATITVSGEGEVLAVPDIGEFSFAVNAEADTATAAQEQSGTKINQILSYLEAQGIAEKDIKTQNYNLFPRYRWESKVCPVGSYCPGGEQVQDGFEVTQTIRVKVRETDMAGAILAGVGERGATNISGLNFTIDDPEALQAEARAKAIADAKTKAGILADQLGVQVVRLVAYSENGSVYEPKFTARTFALDASDEESFAGAELPVGEDSTTARVSVTYEVK